MDFALHISEDNLHHAYFIGGGGSVFDALHQFVEKTLGFTVTGNPDVYVREFETLGIDDARELTTRAHKKAVGEKMLLLCHANHITREAQNSLLKLLEEPPAHTHFFICAPRVESLIPTLRSRVWVITKEETKKDNEHIAESFLKATIPKRMEVIEKFVKEKNVEGAQALLNGLEKALFVGGDTASTDVLAHIIKVKEVLHDRGASLKQLLESVAVLLPAKQK